MDLELLQSLFGVVPLSSTVNTGWEQKKTRLLGLSKGWIWQYDRLMEVKMTMTKGKQNIWTLTTDDKKQGDR